MAIERTTMKRPMDKDLKQTIQKRNARLAAFWDHLGLDVEIIGDMETPAVIKGDYCLACYVHNFNLIFTDHYEQGKEVYRVKLQKIFEYDAEHISEWFKTATHRRIYKIRMLQDPKLFLVGYNYDIQGNEKVKYPVFGKFCPKVYFTREYANDIMNYFELNYCEVI